MIVLLFNKFKGDKVRVLLVRELREMLQVQGEAMQLVKQGLLSVTTVKTDDLDAYDSDCDDISSAKAVLMANLSSYDYDVLSKYLQQTQNAIVQDTNSCAQQDSMIISMFEQMSEQMSNQRVKTFEQRLNVVLSSHEKLIDSQMDDMIQNRNALKQEIDSLKQTLSKQVKEKESLLQIFTVFIKESKEKENKYMDKEIDLEKKIKELDNIIYKVDQSAQTMHMLTKP
ncbi:retrovirus-related pol polyprotein from transposon TNT 1-94 [Tanacetum coccineum]